MGAPPLPTMTSRSPGTWLYVCVCPTIESVYGWCDMMISAGFTPGAVFALAASCRMRKVYVVGLASAPSSQLACVVVHALAATKRNLLVHDMSGAFTSIS